MCHRITPLTMGELRHALDDLRQTGRARVAAGGSERVADGDSGQVPDAYPGTQVPLFVPGEGGGLEPVELMWGFEPPDGLGPRSRLVFNTRIETALSHACEGRGLWCAPIVQGRCLVPVRGFFEWNTRVPCERRAQVRFGLQGFGVFLLAGVRAGDRFSIVTTRPNADVARVHSRMPLVLGPGESSIWLGPDFGSLADRSGIRLASSEE